jgi:hypothetical protein
MPLATYRVTNKCPRQKDINLLYSKNKIFTLYMFQEKNIADSLLVDIFVEKTTGIKNHMNVSAVNFFLM